jgi:HAD superfamily hydrolase (TIGR01450 family)
LLAVKLNPALERYDHVLLDLDGCLWLGDEALPDAPAAVTLLREAGKGIGFLTNDARHAPEDFVRRLWRLGFQAAGDEVVTCGAALQYALAVRGGDAGATAFVVGAPALVEHVAEAGLRIVNNTEFATRADVVVVAAHDAFDYRELRIATQAVLRGAELIGVTRDRTFPMPDGPWPASGPLLAAVEEATGTTATLTVGKPERAMYDTARDRLGEGRYLAVGDRIGTDVAGATRAGMDSALVLSGSTTSEEARLANPRPTLVADSLAALVIF